MPPKTPLPSPQRIPTLPGARAFSRSWKEEGTLPPSSGCFLSLSPLLIFGDSLSQGDGGGAGRGRSNALESPAALPSWWSPPPLLHPRVPRPPSVPVQNPHVTLDLCSAAGVLDLKGT